MNTKYCHSSRGRWALVLLASLTFFGFGNSRNAHAAFIRVQPKDSSPWVADGTTEYELDIYVDNHGLGGAKTDGIQYKLVNTPQFLFVSADLPSSGDFFAGIPMFSGYNSTM